LAGQCGKLKCCLNYELDTYLDALKHFPNTDTKLQTEKGDAVCQKIDIFKKLMWFSYTNNSANWHVLTSEKAQEIVSLNKKNIKITALEDYTIELVEPVKQNFQNAMGQESINRFDQPKKKKKFKKPQGNRPRNVEKK
jgi:hypothetical protein